MIISVSICPQQHVENLLIHSSVLNLLFFLGCYSEDVLNSLNGNISVLSQHLDVTTVVLKDGHTIRYPPQFQSGKQSLRLPCHTCDPSYNIFQIDNRYLIPNNSNVHVLSRNDGYSIDIGSCDPLLLHLGKAGVVWIYCAAQGTSVDIVELHRRTDNTWYAPNGGLHRFPLSSRRASRNSLLSVKEKDGENISFIYFGDGGYLVRRGLEDNSLRRLRRPSSLCATIQELFYVNEELIMMQCALKVSPENSGLVLLNISQPSANPEFFHELGAFSGTVHISGGIVVLLISEIVIIRNAVNATKVEQVIGLQAQLSSQGIFVHVHHTTYFVCTSRDAVYFIDIARALEGNNTAYVKKDSDNEICVDNKCVMQYMSGILFVPLKMSDNPDGLALYSMDPIELITTIYAVTPYRYFFTLELSTENKPTAAVLDVRTGGSSNQNVGSIAGSTVGGVIVIVLAILVIVVIIYVYYKRRTQ